MDDETRRAYEVSLYLDQLRDWLLQGLVDDGAPEDVEIEILAWIPILWSGHEDDPAAVLYRIKGEENAKIWSPGR